jgi:hypothetical protein
LQIGHHGGLDSGVRQLPKAFVNLLFASPSSTRTAWKSALLRRNRKGARALAQSHCGRRESERRKLTLTRPIHD